jgi:hypothetical protein
VVRRLVLAALAASAIVCVPAASAARRTVPRNFMGMVAGSEIVQRPDLAPAQIRLMARSGVQSVKGEFSWARMEPEKGTYDWSETDALVRAAADAHLDVTPTVDGSPVWARRRKPRHDPQEVIEPRNPRDYARFMTALVERYGPRGQFWADNPDVPKKPIRGWEIWNEPEIPHYWRGPWLHPYTRLLRLSYKAVKHADPRARVVLAGLTFRSWKFLRMLYRAGAKGHFDAISLHPYTRKPANVVRTVKLARRVLDGHHDRRIPIWVTELSWTSGLGHARGSTGQPSYLNATERGQARLLRQGYMALAAAHRRYRVSRAYWYTWMTPDKSRVDPFDYSGLRRIRGRHIRSKPALHAYARVAHRLEGK